MFLLCLIIPLVGKLAELGKAGIVVSPIVDAQYEPVERAFTNFPLYAGMKVDILATQGAWRKVKRSDGKIGWVSRDAVLPVIE